LELTLGEWGSDGTGALTGSGEVAEDGVRISTLGMGVEEGEVRSSGNGSSF